LLTVPSLNDVELLLGLVLPPLLPLFFSPPIRFAGDKNVLLLMKLLMPYFSPSSSLDDYSLSSFIEDPPDESSPSLSNSSSEFPVAICTFNFLSKLYHLIFIVLLVYSAIVKRSLEPLKRSEIKEVD